MWIELSEHTIEALAQVISGGSASDPNEPIGLYRRGWELEQWFASCQVRFNLDAGSRHIATRQAISTLAGFKDDNAALERLIEKAADPRDFIERPERHEGVMEYLNRRLEHDGLQLVREGRKVRLCAFTEAGSIANLITAGTKIDFDTVNRDLERAKKGVVDDPEDAITAACSLVESVCRSILVELKVEFPKKLDLAGVYKAVREPLGLSPTKEGVADEISADVRAVLSGLVNAVQGIGALRTHGGDAHGRERGFKRVDPRIARLAIHSASAVAVFLIETWQLRFPGRDLPKSEK
ncbi:abortive infection family protein [Rhizobium sp. 25PS6]|uniref:abortive infection family protein n=1 Tax=Rhizobium sp. 25PS6 TaxID=3075622 RepID=UPI0028FD800A|nr:abortive infection family protein [Rhizobium sp. 25PS6]MDU0364936.1 abortive infection family protein [Rhizobium sp. 25PS6]